VPVSSGRKKKGLAKMAAHVGPNMTPMVDIVMCILIFFMMTMTFTGTELFLTSNMVVQPAGLGTDKSLKVDMPAVRVEITLKLQEDGTTIMHADNVQFTDWMPVGRPDSEIDETSRDRQASLNNDITKKLSELHKAGLSSDALVILRPKGDVPYADLIKVYDACMRAHFAKVAFGPAS
jgi:biopolymer transport protein ExbD